MPIYKSIFFILLAIACLNSTQAQAPISVSFGPVKIGEKRIKINLDNFQVKAMKNADIIKARIIKGTTQWIRTKENFLSPRVLVSISVKSDKTVSLKHHGKNIILQGNKVKNGKLYLNIFDPQEIKVFIGNQQIDQLILNSNVKLTNKLGHLIDYSCSYFGIDVQGLDDQYLSLGCRMERVGPIGKERSRLVLTWSTTNFVLESEQRSPFTSVLMSSDAINISMINAQGERRQVRISAKFKKRFHRLKLALGLGPYGMDSKEDLKEEKGQFTPAIMLYGKWDLTPESSFRGFNATLKSKSLFNNAGLYFAYDIATAFDNRFKLVPLLGAQYLTYKFDSNSKTNNKFIYPQGFEAVFKHIFGIQNYHMVYGMFLSTQTDETYDNIWLRWGRGYFWELNYIRWGRDNQEVETYGLSIGFPIGNFF